MADTNGTGARPADPTPANPTPGTSLPDGDKSVAGVKATPAALPGAIAYDRIERLSRSNQRLSKELRDTQERLEETERRLADRGGGRPEREAVPDFNEDPARHVLSRTEDLATELTSVKKRLNETERAMQTEQLDARLQRAIAKHPEIAAHPGRVLLTEEHFWMQATRDPEVSPEEVVVEMTGLFAESKLETKPDTKPDPREKLEGRIPNAGPRAPALTDKDRREIADQKLRPRSYMAKLFARVRENVVAGDEEQRRRLP